MIYKLTRKGEAMWPGYKLRNVVALRLDVVREGYPHYLIAEGPQDVKALLELELIKESYEAY